jgi:tricorn protease interacting factor F2/3
MIIESYNLKLDVDFDNAEVFGKEVIRIKEPNNIIELDASELEILGVIVDGKKVEFTHKKGKLEFMVDSRNEIDVEISYRKKADEKSIFGFFKSRYDGKYMLVTDFEPDGARSFFPCKDEPSYKASFRVEVRTSRDKKVISNMPVEYIEYEKEHVKYCFQPTPPMSTYLLFVGIGDFKEFSISEAGIDFIAASRFESPDKHNLTLQFMKDSILFFSEYFCIKYPFKKIHWVALPEYITGAMENWGAITSRERILITEDSAVADKIASASTIVHEVAHQWFGDLVTMKWWDDLWLNESFATFMELVCLAKLRPEWKLEETFIHEDLSSGMYLDSLLSTHPISSEIKSPEEAHQVFDAISYSKGASILRMVQDFIGEEEFRKGVSLYLKNFSYSNATRNDFWSMLSMGSGKDVNKMMEAWVTKAGYPFVYVDYRDNRLLLRQSRFTFSGQIDDKWPIPLTLQLNGRKEKIVMEGKESGIDLTSASDIRLNLGRKGFYRVMFSESLLSKILMRYFDIEKEERFGLLDDYFSFLLAGMVNEKTYLDILKLATEDTSWLVSITASDQLFELRSIVGERRTLMDYYIDFHRKNIARLGLTERVNEEPLETVLRSTLAYRLALCDITFASKLSKEINNYETINKNMRRPVIVSYVFADGDNSFSFLSKKIKESKDEHERSDIYMALSMSRDKEIVSRTLDMVKEQGISRSDTLYPIVYSSMNPYARDILWEWIKRNNSFLKNIYSDTQQLVSLYRRVLPRCGIGNEYEVKSFIKENLSNMKIASSVTEELLEVYSRASKLFSQNG